MCDGYDALLRRRLSSTARVLREVCLRKSINLSAWLTGTDGRGTKGEWNGGCGDEEGIRAGVL